MKRPAKAVSIVRCYGWRPRNHLTSAIIALAFGALLTLSACGGFVRTNFPAIVTPSYHPTLVWYASNERGMPTVIRGTAFRERPNEGHDIILANLRLPHWHEPARFYAVPAGLDTLGRRLVFVLNPVSPVAFGEACRNLDAIPLGEPSGEVRIHAEFCEDERAVSAIDTRDAVAGPEDPRLARSLNRLLADLLPSSK